MSDWDGSFLNKSIVLLSSLGFLMIGMQVGLFHYRGNFRHPVMWAPVVTAPFIGVLGFLAVAYNKPLIRTIFMITLTLELVAGVVGFIYHARGVSLRVGGWEMRNFLTGPPIMLPLMLTALSILGLVAVLM